MNTEYWTRQVQQLHNDGQGDLADDVTALIDAGELMLEALCCLDKHHQQVRHPDEDAPKETDELEAVTAWVAVLQKQ